MKKTLANLVVLSVLLSAANLPALAGDAPAGPVTREEVVAFVDRAVDYAKKNGKKKALAEFMRQDGPFVRGNLYIFAYDYDGKVISHGGQPEFVGKNLIDRTDTDGKKIIVELRELARHGSGWLRYNWEDRLTRKIRPKLGYVKRVDDTWWLGSGLYEDEMDLGEAADGPVTPEEVAAFVGQAVDYAKKNGKKKALAEFMRQDGPFVRGNLYIFAYDYDGKVISHGGQPEFVGKNLIDRTDTDGKKIIVELRDLARQGSGWLRYNWEDRLTRKIRPKLGFVAKVDDTWWLGSGLYEDEMNLGRSFSVDARTALGLLVASADANLQKVLASLYTAAETREAASGEWEQIRPLLATAARRTGIPGVFFYIRPDGSYYTVEKGLQKKTVSDRPYFAELMAGRAVRGFLVISRSTGEKSAVLGAPIVKGGKVVGALGTSVFLGPLSSLLREAMALPPNQFFFAIDEQGRTALHQNRDFLYNHPADMGSPSLASAVKQMLGFPEGTVQWDLGGLGRIAVFKKSGFNGWCYGLAELAPVEPSPNAIDEVLAEITRDVTNILEKMEKDLSRAANDLARTDLTGKEARKIIADLYAKNPLAVDCGTVSKKGKLLLLEPAEYADSEGADISQQEHIARLLKTKKPVLSGVFRSVEGYDCVDIEMPVFTPKGKFLGGVSLMFRPEVLLKAVLSPSVAGRDMEAWAMQTDGVILYEPDKELIGRSVLAEPDFTRIPAVAGLYQKMAKEPRGRQKYALPLTGQNKAVEQEMAWDTAGLFGTDWRVAVTQVKE